MKSWIAVVSLALVMFGVAPARAQGKPPVAAPAPPALSEVQTLKGQVFLLKATNLNLQRQSVEAQLKAATDALDRERLTLEADFIKTLACTNGWDWGAMGCTPAPPKPTDPPKK